MILWHISAKGSTKADRNLFYLVVSSFCIMGQFLSVSFTAVWLQTCHHVLISNGREPSACHIRHGEAITMERPYIYLFIIPAYVLTDRAAEVQHRAGVFISLDRCHRNCDGAPLRCVCICDRRRSQSVFVVARQPAATLSTRDKDCCCHVLHYAWVKIINADTWAARNSGTIILQRRADHCPVRQMCYSEAAGLSHGERTQSCTEPQTLKWWAITWPQAKKSEREWEIATPMFAHMP